MNRDERELREKLRRIEALFAGAKTDGERMAAAAAMERIKARLRQAQKVETTREYVFTMPDRWSSKLFVALCRRYGLDPFRYKRQRLTTVRIVAPPTFVENILWPEYQQLHEALEHYLQAATDRIIREEVNSDVGDIRSR